jgi:hypothetical protein
MIGWLLGLDNGYGFFFFYTLVHFLHIRKSTLKEKLCGLSALSFSPSPYPSHMLPSSIIACYLYQR